MFSSGKGFYFLHSCSISRKTNSNLRAFCRPRENFSSVPCSPESYIPSSQIHLDNRSYTVWSMLIGILHFKILLTTEVPSSFTKEGSLTPSLKVYQCNLACPHATWTLSHIPRVSCPDLRIPKNLSLSAVVKTETIFWTSFWPFHRNQNIIPLLWTMAKSGKQSIRRPESQSWYLKARWWLLFLLSESTARWTALPREQYSCKPKHAGEEGRPQDSLCMHVCMHVKASTVRASLKGCSSATSCAHKHLCGLLLAGAQEATTRAYLTAWLCKILQENSCAWHVESFGGLHISACMSLATKIHFRTATEAYPLCPHCIRALR